MFVGGVVVVVVIVVVVVVVAVAVVARSASSIVYTRWERGVNNADSSGVAAGERRFSLKEIGGDQRCLGC